MTQAAFMCRVHAALGRSATAPAPKPPEINQAIARLASATDDIVGMFATRAEASGMKVHRLPSTALLEKLTSLLKEKNVRTASISMRPERRPDVDQAIAAAGVREFDWRSDRGLDGQYDLDAGITDVHAGIAETGTLVCCSDANHSRGSSLVQPIHIVVMRAGDVLPDMLDYWAGVAGLRPQDRPSSTAFITGPSKTADIEGILITGVHGPKEVHVLLVDGEGERVKS